MKIDQPQFYFILSTQQSESLLKLIVQVLLWTFLMIEENEQLKSTMKGYFECLREVAMQILRCSEWFLMHCYVV